jgi:hypothetical protein
VIRWCEKCDWIERESSRAKDDAEDIVDSFNRLYTSVGVIVLPSKLACELLAGVRDAM